MSRCPFARLVGQGADGPAAAAAASEASEATAATGEESKQEKQAATGRCPVTGIQVGRGAASRGEKLQGDDCSGSGEEGGARGADKDGAEQETRADGENGAGGEAARTKTKSAGQAASGGRCPYGFDSGANQLGSVIGPFSCVLCKALLHAATKCDPCGHIFCRGCIARFSDCPICGADIAARLQDAKMQKAVDDFINAHVRRRWKQQQQQQQQMDTGVNGREEGSIKADVDAALDLMKEEDGGEGVGNFLMKQAMRALQLGNFESARCRMEMVAEELREALNQSEEGERTEGGGEEWHGQRLTWSCQLGAVVGSAADCCRMMGDSAAAESLYSESIQLLSRLPQNNNEVVHSLAVTLNKQGDLSYQKGDFASAQGLYLRALHLREKAAGFTEGGEGEGAVQGTSQASPATLLDLAVSLSKVADIDLAIGNKERSLANFQRAAKILSGMDLHECEQLGAGFTRKRESVLAFLEAQLQDKK